ncbi:FadR/GntR family transcriptional regulator [Phyllobacterium myrsinacearum]|uniref:DNA-binding FadR family transcriptional regulator n=1 Tax=Phyllobacterium myrsinacearum TaxID=28101 RepID=A0A839ELI0_9HYPH|nr:FadR/GntR family transcriptional regulator [Phyllobacterium myrsinacearum]MBA8879679.1 DNA-binding FadR family transcriptional regulator [Phyllobacterium myrsinacearum]
MSGIGKRETLTGQLVKAIADRITSGQYRRGERLPTEQEMIGEFNVSRTVVREAIANLKAKGLVHTQQGIGAFVLKDLQTAPFRIEEDNLELLEEIISVMELRISIELEAAALAAVRRDETELARIKDALDMMKAAIEQGESSVQADLEFHRAIAIATKNRHFLSMFNYLGEMLIPRTRLQTHKINGLPQREYLERVNREHDQIYQSIKAQDVEGARAAMRLHLGSSRDRLRTNAPTTGKKLP